MNESYELEPLANYHCNTGENPLWQVDEQALYWVDIPPGRLFRYDARSGKHEKFYEGDTIGGFTFQEDGSLILFETDRISHLSRDGKRTTLVEGIDDDMARFNDVIADPEGRVFAGTIGKDDQRGGLYRVDVDGTVTSLFKGSGCSNGMAFTSDLKQFYWTCSTTRRIFRFDYDRKTGELSNRHLLVQCGDDEGIPDGLTIDTDGNLWSARWDGHSVCKLSPEGETIAKIPFPVAKVSSVVFGGPNLDTLYATTAGGSDDSDTWDGTLYRVKVDAKGLPEFRSRLTVG